MTFGMQRADEVLVEEADLPITLDKLHNAASSMNQGKAPGIDGLTLEFYLTFWKYMGPLLLILFERILDLGGMQGMTAMGVVMLVPKKGDLRLISNWRPITLLSVDLKIIAKSVANKLSPIIKSIVPHSQTALPGRSIFSSLAIVRDIISLSMKKKNPLVILTLDQSNAFDRVSHTFLFHLLQVVGIPPILLAALKAIYTGFRCVIRNGGELSDPFPYLRGIRQGDATSSLLFSLVAQPFLNLTDLVLVDQGFQCENVTRLYTSYADDTTFFLQSIENVDTIVKCFQEISVFSEAKLNLQKSAIITFNLPVSLEGNKHPFYKSIPILDKSIKILGIDFISSTRISQNQWSRTYNKAVFKLENAAPFLKNQSYIERAKWAKRKLWPPWSFLLKTLQPTEVQIGQLNSLFSEAIWLGGKRWLSVEAIGADISRGGLRAVVPSLMINTLRIMFLSSQYQMDRLSPSRQLADIILSSYGGLSYGLDLLHSKPDRRCISSLPPFYASAYLAWDTLPLSILPLSKEELLSLPAANSRMLLELDPPIQISVGMALSWGIKSINDIYEKQPSSTRLSLSTISMVRDYFDRLDTEIFIQAKEVYSQQQLSLLNGKERNNQTPFWFHSNDTMLHMSKWSNSKVTNILVKQIMATPLDSIDPSTWNALHRVEAPSPFINATWRVFHNRFNSASFYFHAQLIPELVCIFCSSPDTTVTHQFIQCQILEKITASLKTNVELLGLEPLPSFECLFDLDTMDHRWANFTITMYIYTVINYTKRIINNKEPPNKDSVYSLFFTTLKEHVKCMARKFPPGIIENRGHWDLITHAKIYAYFQGIHLYIFDGSSFEVFDPP